MFRTIAKSVLAFLVLTVVFEAVLLHVGGLNAYLDNKAILGATKFTAPVTMTKTDQSVASFAVMSRRWLDDYGIKVTTASTNSSNHSYEWDPISKSNASEYNLYWVMFDHEIRKYSKTYFKNIGLRSVTFVSDLQTHEGTSTLGFADVTNGSVYFTAFNNSRAETAVVKSTIHHEIAHQMSYTHYGDRLFDNNDWLRFNEANFEYAQAKETYADYFYPTAGFVSNYALNSAAEDMAEVFAYVFTDEYRQELTIRAGSDKTLSSKVRSIRSIVDEADGTIWPEGAVAFSHE